MNKKAIRPFLAVALTLMLAMASPVLGQGITTSALSGTLSNKAGTPIPGGTVTIVHEPSGTRTTATTRASGQFDVSGLRVGGPYTVSSGSEVRRDVYLELGQVADVSLPAPSEVVQMAAFSVTGERDTTFDAGRMGGGSTFTDDQIVNIASVRSDVQDIARLDSRLTLTSLDQGGQLSAQGQNFRFNSFLIDGVEANDPFGLNSNGVSSLRGPIALESIEAVSIELNPYDVRRSGFTGALINAVTKSGGNNYTGSLYYEFSDDGWRAKNPRTGVKEFFEERRYGLTLSGPILRDRLFFAFNYDDFRRESSAPQAGFLFTPASLALINQAVARARTLGYETGTFAGAQNVATQKTYLGKLDWNISDSHRVSYTYRENEGVTPNFTGVTSTTGSSLSNMWFDQPRNTTSHTAQAFSRWTSDFRTEVSYSTTDYNASPVNRGKPFPAIGIGGLAGTNTSTGLAANGFLNFGTEFSRQLNQLTTKEKLFKVSGEFSFGHHTLAAGGEWNSTDTDNRFLQHYYGNYTFNNSAAFGTTPARTGVENWIAGLPTAYTNSQPLAGNTVEQVFARWTYNAYAFFVQNTWRPNNRFTVTGGVRYDMPTVDRLPPFSPSFAAAFGLRNDATIDGNNTIAPRVGFNYRVPGDRKTEVRGGVGLFQGKNPAVWLANAYQNAGTAGTVTVNVNGNNQPALQFQPDVTRQPIPAGNPPAPTINLTQDGFKMPSSWKGNLAVDHRLPFWGLMGTVEFTATKVHKGLFIEYLNYATAGTGPNVLPDGRTRYAGNITPNYNTNAAPNNVTTFPQTNLVGRRRVSTGGPTGAGFADVFRLNNTDKGESTDITFAINRPFKNNWAAGISWTRGHATEVSPMTSSTAGSLYTTRAIYNPNENIASTSNTATKDKIVGQAMRRFEFIKGYRTTVAAVWESRTGRTYSWVFAGDANGDGISANDLFYMPTGPADTRVRWINATERDAFFAYAAANDLNKYAGTVLPRNSERSPWVNVVDLTITQEIPIYKRVRSELFLQIVNLGNLLNDSWGLTEEIPFNYKRTVAGAIYDPVTNQYGYVFNGNTLAGLPIVADDTQTSRWQAKLGVRLKF